ncbi:MAG: preprotein translocase subunit SecA [Dethiobacter sp.]|nr:preprotein translocase subunit SecA [Dethiobacter sp.]
MRGLLAKILGDVNQRELKKITPLVEQINAQEERLQALSDGELRAKTDEFRVRLEQALQEARGRMVDLRRELAAEVDAEYCRELGRDLQEAEKELFAAERAALNELLPEAFAVVREASRRTLGMRHFDVQLIGGVVLHQGRIAEMKTGEGKTLAATLPAYLNALLGRGVHIVTVNDYLAKRDSEWMGPVYLFLGLSVGLIAHGLEPDQRRAAYAADITYGTNNEFGFDYLRDNMVIYREQLSQRELYYAIVDEVDSILVDEARTPLIISGQMKDDKKEEDYLRFDGAARTLKKERHYTVDEKARTVELTEDGQREVERLLGEKNLYGEESIAESEVHDLLGGARLELSQVKRKKMENALRSHALMQRDRDYVVKDGEVIIVDEFTGRLMFGRRYSDGLHQAIEAKERVKVAKESMTLASITFQNYFRMYKKLSGMTGTAATEEEEFQKIYGMDVVVIPTHKPMIRRDLPDAVYKTERGKFGAVVEDIAKRNATGQPLLVGTISIEKSEELSRLLQKRGIRHEVLNAKHHEKEANIIAQAGRLGAVTIATNMAGRGTDILLGGNHVVLAEREFSGKYGMLPDIFWSRQDVGDNAKEEARHFFTGTLPKYQEITRTEKEKVIGLGGLHILGTERHEARRIDNQLRGRSGRQGDPGSSQFYLSMEDDLMRLFGGDNILGIMERLGLEEDVPIDHPLIGRAIETAQKKVEARNFDLRKHVLEYDNVVNEQREIIYSQRRRVLGGENLREQVLGWIAELVAESLALHAGEKVYDDEWDLSGLLHYAESLFLPLKRFTMADLQSKSREELREMLLAAALDFYREREQQLGLELMREVERVILLSVVDSKWMYHIDAMDDLRQGVGLRAYGQRDPLVEYKYEAYEMFQEMVNSIKKDVVRELLHRRIMVEPRRQTVAVVDEMPRSSRTAADGAARSAKVGRNEPCSCGSGKKYKKCCGK